MRILMTKWFRRFARKEHLAAEMLLDAVRRAERGQIDADLGGGVIKLNELGSIQPLHMGVVLITTLVFGLITPPYGLSLLVASKFVGVSFSRAMFASLPIYVVFLVTIAFTVLFPSVVLYLPKLLLPESVGCFKNPSGTGYICPK